MCLKLGKRVQNNLQDELLIKRGFKARAFHAILFEVIAIFLTSLILVFIMQQSFMKMSGLALIISFMATCWNGIFNFLFDQLQKKLKFHRTTLIRFAHASLFELGLLVFTLPIVAAYLQVSLLNAFLLDIGLLAFFLPYSMLFNAIYDKIYLRIYN